jgi:hypothetical protein
MMPELAITRHRWPDRIVVPWQRLECGLWRRPQGDINAAYSANSLPIVRAFLHEQRPFTTLGLHYHPVRPTEAWCHPLLPPDSPPSSAGFREGTEVIWKRRPFRLGPQVIFAGTELAVQDWRCRLRIYYADGGCYARQPCYRDFLAGQPEGQPPAFTQAVALELDGEFAGLSKLEMQQRLDGKAEPTPRTQLGLGL